MAMTWRAPAASAPSSADEADAAEADDGDALPSFICAQLIAAPTPVSTAQPNSAATSSGRSGSTLTSEPRLHTAYSAKQETPT